MKTSVKFLFLLFAVTMLTAHVHAQSNTYPIISTEVTTNCLSNCLTIDSLPYVSDSTIISVQIAIQLFDVTGISSLHVKLGTTSGGSDLLDKTFDFDVMGNVGNGCSYSRTDYLVTLGLGNYNGLTSYFSEVILERDDHTLTDAIVFNR